MRCGMKINDFELCQSRQKIDPVEFSKKVEDVIDFYTEMVNDGVDPNCPELTDLYYLLLRLDNLILRTQLKKYEENQTKRN